MSQSPATFNTPHPMKKKIITALVAVVIGHVGVLWAVSHMKTMELKPVEKEPLKVRFLTIKEDVPPPPAKVEPIKPKVEPKPVEKKVEPKPVEKPKVIAQKVQKVEPKVIQQDDTQEKLKKQQELEKQRLEQLQREQMLKEQQAREQALREQQAREQAQREQKAQEDARKSQPIAPGEVSWSRKPAPSYKDTDLEGSERTIIVHIEAEPSGKILSVTVKKSTGLSKLDDIVLKAVRRAKFKPTKDGRAINGDLPLELVKSSS
ncbi:Ferric siderophore transport system, periplasmic binding protein TonB [Acinetobacter sp. neg1]|uniref:TonB family protein n=1 Tax=Acinetobacter TaxID=469 RepID=UPI000543F296|nr:MULTISPECIES: TonB family protein [Acinetobacter]KHF76389.1 Ferric siderophore transport system, periplasmic binding protein TonB [Acinetobacter sp. neg1]MBJ8483596.1 TonB family protein [Acinetobacter vivianii]